MELPTRLQASRRGLALGAIALAGYVGAGVFSHRAPRQGEKDALQAANHDGVPHAWLWPFQQLGTPWMLPGSAVLLCATGRRRLALAAALALPLEKAGELTARGLVSRSRPARSVPGTRLRDDAPAQGTSYPSGHTAIVTCLGTLLWPGASNIVRLLIVAGTTGAGYARLHQGAHHVVDVLGGACLGVALGTVLSAAVSTTSP